MQYEINFLKSENDSHKNLTGFTEYSGAIARAGQRAQSKMRNLVSNESKLDAKCRRHDVAGTMSRAQCRGQNVAGPSSPDHHRPLVFILNDLNPMWVMRFPLAGILSIECTLRCEEALIRKEHQSEKSSGSCYKARAKTILSTKAFIFERRIPVP